MKYLNNSGGQVNDTMVEEAAAEAVKILKDFKDNKKYGEVKLEIQAGKIVRCVKTESIKLV